MIAFKGGRLSSGGKASGSGSNFGGLVRYLIEGDRSPDGSLEAAFGERVSWVETRNLDTMNPTSAAKIMRSQAAENPRVERPVYHFGLSLDEGEHLSREQWVEAADRVLKGMGLEHHQVLMVAHGDTDKEHVHLVVNRVGDDGRAWNARQDMAKAYEVVHGLERELGLYVTGAEAGRAPELSASAYREARRLGEAPLIDRVRTVAGSEFAAASDWRDLEERLASHALRLEPARNGSGLLVTDGKRLASLSSVDRELSGPRLETRFGESFRAYREREPQAPAIASPSTREALRGETLQERASSLVERVTATRATYTESDLRRASFYETDSRALLAEALSPVHSVPVGTDGHGTARYSAQEYLEAEAKLFRSAEGLAGRGGFRLEGGGVGKVLERLETSLGISWSEEQKAAVFHATQGADLAQIVGRAGAGKTTAARAIAAAYQAAGYEVRGAALAGKAAEGLSREAGVQARTLASWEYAWKEGRDHLHGGSVLLVDEAGMVDARTLGRVLGGAERVGAKVILFGDPDQLKAIGAGDAYRGLLARHESASLEEIRRQVEPWQRLASHDLAAGRVGPALEAYETAGRVTWASSQGEARARLVAQYVADREPGSSQIALAYRNADARLLNEAIREQLQVKGEVEAGGVEVNGRLFGAGDRLVFLQNDHRGALVTNEAPAASVGVKNGTLGTVELAGEERFRVRLDDGRSVAFDPRQYDQVAHGFAVTIHKSQGATVDRAYVLTDPLMDRHASYVALTRHRHGVEIYADRERLGDRERLVLALSRESRKDLAIDYLPAAAPPAPVLSKAGLEALGARIDGLARAHEEARRTLADLSRRSAEVFARPVSNFERDAERMRSAQADVEAAQRRLQEIAGRVYRDPETALARLDKVPPGDTKRLLLDVDRMKGRASGAEAFGALVGEVKKGFVFTTVYADRVAAVDSLPDLRQAILSLREHRGNLENLGKRQAEGYRAGSSLAYTPPVDRGLLARVTEQEKSLREELASLRETQEAEITRAAVPLATELQKLDGELLAVEAQKGPYRLVLDELEQVDRAREELGWAGQNRDRAAAAARGFAGEVYKDPEAAIAAWRREPGLGEFGLGAGDMKTGRAPGAERFGELRGEAKTLLFKPNEERLAALRSLVHLPSSLMDLRAAEQRLDTQRQVVGGISARALRLGPPEQHAKLADLARAGLGELYRVQARLEDTARKLVTSVARQVAERAVGMLAQKAVGMVPGASAVLGVAKVLSIVRSLSRGQDEGLGF